MIDLSGEALMLAALELYGIQGVLVLVASKVVIGALGKYLTKKLGG